MEPRIIDSMPFADYQAALGINASVLKIVHQHSLAHAKAYLDGTFAKESAALDFGRAFHSLALEGREDFEVRPATYQHPKEGEKPWNGNATVCKEWLAAHDGSLIISSAEHEALMAMNDAVGAHLPSGFPSRCEASVFAERDGLAIKARIDCLPLDDDAPVIDLKTCRDANPEQFMKDAFRLGYHIQAAWSLDILRKVGIRRKTFRFVAVECEAPFAVAVIDFHDTELSALRMGRRHANAAFNRLAGAQKTGHWDAYGHHEAEEFIPPWLLKEVEQTA